MRKLKNGGEAPQILVTLVMMHLQDLITKANPDHPTHNGDGSMSISYMLALYDLLELCKSEAYSPNCFGGNRQKLLDRHLVENGASGMLYVRPEIRDIVLSAVTFDPITTVIQVRSPFAEGSTSEPQA